MEYKICLASKSPRRKQLLSEILNDFTVYDPAIDERGITADTAEEECVKISLAKAQAAKNKLGDYIIISADTIVECQGKKLGKPIGPNEALEMLTLLGGKTHRVLTGITVAGKETLSRCDVTAVTFHRLTDAMIVQYIEDYKPFDKAGAYGIQDNFPLIKEIVGSRKNVMGLEPKTVKEMLKTLGVTDFREE